MRIIVTAILGILGAGTTSALISAPSPADVLACMPVLGGLFG